jgi:hypothetical protein
LNTDILICSFPSQNVAANSLSVLEKIAVQPSQFLFESSFIILSVNFVTKSVKCKVARMRDSIESDEQCGEVKLETIDFKYW